MKTGELDYDLPETLIASHPAPQRDQSRLMVLDRENLSIREDTFRNVGRYLRPGDCLVVNDTRVVRARLIARKPTGGKVEIFLLRPLGGPDWEALVRPSARVKSGMALRLSDGTEVSVQETLEGGKRRVVLDVPDLMALLERVGNVPLPPYIGRSEDPHDSERYQTVYAQRPGAVAAPTAGLHFTETLLEELQQSGIQRAAITLHVGYGTFRPILSETLEDHRVDGESFDFPEETAVQLNATRGAEGRVVAVGTTTTRVLETQFWEDRFHGGGGITERYIYPPYRFEGVDALQTNFHLPRSSLLALVCAFAGREFVLEAYHRAIALGFRFYSYGDAMLIL